MLRVALNATPLLAPRTGIGNYVLELGRALELRDDLQLQWFAGFGWRASLPDPGVDEVEVRRPWRERVKPLVPFRRELRHAHQWLTFGRGLHRRSIDVYHEPNYVPIRFDVPVVMTVHDLSWIHFPDAHPADRVRWLDRGFQPALSRAGAILVDSHAVENELTQTFGVPGERIHVAPLGVRSIFSPRAPGQTRRTLDALNLAHVAYVLSVGTIEPRKNLRHALRAYAALPAPLQQRFPLVIAGARGWKASDLERDLHRLAMRGHVRFLGHVADSMLVDLYCGAAAFVFPSLYEGFGLPPLEAMACGVPVLVSNRGALTEVTGDAGIPIDPDDVAATTKRLASLLENDRERADRAVQGIRQAARFTWSDCANRTASAYRAAARLGQRRLIHPL